MSSPERVAGAVVFCLGVASFGVLAWASGTGIELHRTLNAGDLVFMSVFAVFGSFCMLMAWRLFRSRSSSDGAMAAADVSDAASALPPKRVTASNACAAVGVILLVLAAVLPDHWYPVVPLFVGIALLSVSHALTPCEERIDKLRKMRNSLRQDSMRQL